jgi:DNA-binding MarR family transcriptional regulator
MAAVPNAFVHPASILALEVFRLNGILVAVGDTLVAPLGLTSARWQVMGAIAEAKGMLPVAGIARNMGLVRQSVQRIADELAQLGIVHFVPNPHHRRANLVQLTDRGTAVFEDACTRWLTVADVLAADIGRDEAEHAAALLRRLRNHLETLEKQGESL